MPRSWGDRKPIDHRCAVSRQAHGDDAGPRGGLPPRPARWLGTPARRRRTGQAPRNRWPPARMRRRPLRFPTEAGGAVRLDVPRGPWEEARTGEPDRVAPDATTAWTRPAAEQFENRRIHPHATLAQHLPTSEGVGVGHRLTGRSSSRKPIVSRCLRWKRFITMPNGSSRRSARSASACCSPVRPGSDPAAPPGTPGRPPHGEPPGGSPRVA